jgi:hypothetical protein
MQQEAAKIVPHLRYPVTETSHFFAFKPSATQAEIQISKKRFD